MAASQPEAAIKGLGIAGSLREASYNRALLRAAHELAPDDLEIEVFENETLQQIPLYNEDIRAQGDPRAVKALKDAIRKADGRPGTGMTSAAWSSSRYGKSLVSRTEVWLDAPAGALLRRLALAAHHCVGTVLRNRGSCGSRR